MLDCSARVRCSHVFWCPVRSRPSVGCFDFSDEIEVLFLWKLVTELIRVYAGFCLRGFC